MGQSTSHHGYFFPDSCKFAQHVVPKGVYEEESLGASYEYQLARSEKIHLMQKQSQKTSVQVKKYRI
jgi:hypothetical protein